MIFYKIEPFRTKAETKYVTTQILNPEIYKKNLN